MATGAGDAAGSRTTTDRRWVDDDWRRDWLFWLAVSVTVVNLVGAAVRTDRPWWQLALGVPISFGFTVALVGFFRVVVRTYRAP